MARPAMPVRLTMRNAGALAANFRSKDQQLQREVRRIVRENGQFCKELTQFFAPRDTGFMADHVETTYTHDGLIFETGWDSADFFEAGLQWYVPYVEWGTSKMAAQPSLTPAYEETVVQFKRDLSKALRNAGRRAH